MKRSKVIELVLIGSSLVSMQACNQRNAATFTSKQECERTHGEGKCVGSSEHHHRGNSLFVPMMMGYQATRLMRAPGIPSHNDRPVVRGGFGKTGRGFSSFGS